MKIRHNGNSIEFTDTYRPSEIIVNGEFASMDLYAEFHEGVNWMATASGNKLFYRTETGNEYTIPQSRFSDVWQDEVRELIEKSKMTMKDVSDVVGIPYRTLQDWRAGRSTPTNITKIAFRTMMSEIIK